MASVNRKDWMKGRRHANRASSAPRCGQNLYMCTTVPIRKATKEVLQFSKDSDFKKCSVMKDKVLYYTGRILDGQCVDDMENIMPSAHVCEMNNQPFLIFGSLLAFYIPMVIITIMTIVMIMIVSR